MQISYPELLLLALCFEDSVHTKMMEQPCNAPIQLSNLAQQTQTYITNTYIHKHTCTYIHTYKHTNKQTYIHIYIHAGPRRSVSPDVPASRGAHPHSLSLLITCLEMHWI
jgi:hypothetical protein